MPTGLLTPPEHEGLHDFLDTVSTMALATVTAGGRPQVTPLFFVADEKFHLYWLSPQDSRHGKNLGDGAPAAATVYPSLWHWEDMRAVQIEGVARPINDERVREQVLKRYLQKFNLSSAYDQQIVNSRLFVLAPKIIRWLDNTVNVGYRTQTEV